MKFPRCGEPAPKVNDAVGVVNDPYPSDTEPVGRVVPRVLSALSP